MSVSWSLAWVAADGARGAGRGRRREGYGPWPDAINRDVMNAVLASIKTLPHYMIQDLCASRHRSRRRP